jgi:hypothetical protein
MKYVQKEYKLDVNMDWIPISKSEISKYLKEKNLRKRQNSLNGQILNLKRLID